MDVPRSLRHYVVGGAYLMAHLISFQVRYCDSELGVTLASSEKPST